MEIITTDNLDIESYDRIIQPVQEQTSYAAIIQRDDPSSRSYTRYSGIQKYRARGEMPSTFKEQADLVWPYYKYEDQTNTTINMMVDFCCHDIHFEGNNEDIKIYDAIYKNADMYNIVRAILIYYFSLSNAFPYRFIPSKMKSIKLDEKTTIPNFQWTVIDPRDIDIQGDFLTELQYFYNTGKQSGGALSSGTGDITLLNNSSDKKALDAYNIKHIAWNKLPKERFATPFLIKIINKLKLRELLIEADFSTLSGIINMLVHVKKGDKSNYIPNKSELENLANILQSPQSSYILVTDDLVNIDIIAPDVKILDPKKYVEVNAQIEAAFGISREFISGSTGQAAIQWINIVRLVETLDHARSVVERYLDAENEKIFNDLQKVKSVKLTAPCSVRLDKVNLREEIRIRDILMNLYERGLPSADRLYQEAGLDMMTELNKKAFEKYGTIDYEGQTINVAELLEPPTLNNSSNQGGRPSGTVGITQKPNVNDSVKPKKEQKKAQKKTEQIDNSEEAGFNLGEIDINSED